MTPKTFYWLLLVLLVVFIPMYTLIGLVPTGSLLIEFLQSMWTSVTTGQRVIWIHLVLSVVSLIVCAAVAWAITRMVYWFQGKSRDIAGAAALLVSVIIGALPIYGVSVHGRVRRQSAFSAYAHQFDRGSL